MATRSSADTRPRVALLEREHLLAQLSELGAAAARGRGAIVTISGRPGEGKTALIATLAEVGARHGLDVFQARGEELERDFPFGVVRQLLEPAIAPLASRRRGELFEGAAGLAAGVFGNEATPPPDNSLLVLHSLYWLLARLAADRPTLLAVDDMHWADETSLDWLAYLRGRIERLPVLLVGATRPPEPDGRSLAALASDPGVVRMKLEALQTESIELMIEHRFGMRPRPGFGAACRRVTGGNPFAVTELLGELARSDATPDVASAAELEALAPAGLQSSVLRRLAAMENEAAAFARALAVLGNEAPLWQASRLACLELDASARFAEALMKAGILDEGPRLRFLHPLLRTAVYESIGHRARARLHAAAAELLARDGAAPQTIAAHLLRSDPAGSRDSVEQLRAAAREAMRQGAPGAAIRHLRRALAEPPAAELRTKVLAELGKAEWMDNGPETVELLELARASCTDPEERLEIDQLLADACCYAGRLELMNEVLRRAIEEVEDRDPELAARMHAMSVVAVGIADSGWPAERDAQYLELAQRLADFPDSARVLTLGLGFVNIAGGRRRPAEILPGIEATLGDLVASREPGDGMSVALGLFALIFADRYELVTRLANRMLIDGAALGASRVLGVANHVLAVVALRRGALAEAQASAEASFELSNVGRLRLVTPLIVASLAETLLYQGKVEQATERLREIPLETSGLSMRYFGRVALARLHCARGQREAALAQLETLAKEAAINDISNPSYVPWRSEMALLVAERDCARARELANSELEDASRLGLARSFGIALRARAAAERGAAREETLREAIAVLEGTEARLELARALVDLGGELRRRGRRSEARTPLRSALELAHLCGAAPLAALVGDELHAADGRPRRPWLTGVASLTPSELRVASRAAAGSSNREIAEGLFVTTKTVEMHLTNAYRKLGAGSRTELAELMGQPMAGG